eukprot:2075778-Prymnesium_polylepis.1
MLAGGRPRRDGNSTGGLLISTGERRRIARIKRTGQAAHGVNRGWRTVRGVRRRQRRDPTRVAVARRS